MSFKAIGISFHRESIPVETMSPSIVRDMNWRYVDKQGHGHFWGDAKSKEVDALATLEFVVTGTTWVGDGIDGDEVEIGEWRCRQCGEVLEPGTKAEYGPSHVPGLLTVAVTFGDEEFLLGESQWVEVQEEWLKVLRAVRP